MKALIYEIRDCLLKNFDYIKQSKYGKPHLDRFGEDYKKLNNVLISPKEIISIAKKLLVTAVIDRDYDPLNKENESPPNIINFYNFLHYIYDEDISGIPVKKNYYHFVEDFAENLWKLKVPNFDRLKINDVFHEEGYYNHYIEINVKGYIFSFLIQRTDDDKQFIFNIIYSVYDIDRFKNRNPSLSKNAVEYPFAQFIQKYSNEDDKNHYAIEDDFLFEMFKTDKNEKNELLHFLINCLLYIQSGDPDIRYMKGENPKKYKINSKDSFFEKKKKQELQKDAVFNDYELVGWNYKKQYNVAGHWRYQAYGPKWSQHKLIFIESFKKGAKK